jgi:Antirepressor regulating drug resistance, predicted signal transduction N-terminal membrane component
MPAVSAAGSDEINISGDIDKKNQMTAENEVNTGEPVRAASDAERSAFNWENAALAWMVGLAAILLYLLTINTAMLFKMKKLPLCTSRDVLRILDQCKASLNIKSGVKVVYDNSLRSPALFGIFTPRIIISPEVVKKLSDEELKYVFLHELSHLKRHDLFINGVMLIIQSIYWFNPFIWYSLRQMKNDCEIACDARVLKELAPQDRRQYGQAIINLLQLLAQPQWAPGTLGYVSKYNRRRITMISSNKKASIMWVFIALTALFIVGCSSLNTPGKAADQGTNQQITDNANSPSETSSNNQSGANTNSSSSSNTVSASSIVYQNTQYGFNFTLPVSWQGYSIITSKWQGTDVQSGKITETGPIISIRHPQWTASNPRQDIPIMVLTLNQWNLVQSEKLSLGAAPIGPTELGRNSTYVFALPARYNFAFPTGFEEVEKIMADHPLKAN